MQNGIKIIFHIDLNQFFCTCAMLENKSLVGKAFAIGRENTFKGIISTASYEARKYNINSGMSLAEAFRLCPKLIVVNPDRRLYHKHSEIFFNYLKTYTDKIEQASIDECYLDVTHLMNKIHPLKLAKHIQDELLNIHHLPVSIGIGPTTFLAKMGSDLKKPLGITVIRKREIEQVLYPLDVKEIHGIGKKTYPKLYEKNIKTIQDFISIGNKEKVLNIVGTKIYEHVKDCLQGKSSDIVDPNRYSASESMGTSRSFDENLSGEGEIEKVLIEMAKYVHARILEEKYLCKTISIVLKDSDYKTINRSITLDEYTNDYYIIADKTLEIFEDNYDGKLIRLCGVTLANLIKKDEIVEEYNLFTYQSILEKEQCLNLLVKNYQNKFGDNIIKLGIKNKTIE